MENQRKYLIYIIKNKINDKVYIGQTSTSIRERFMQHTKPSVLKKRGTYKLYNAMSKYGKENFYCELLENNLESDEADNKEIYYIDKYNSYENGYNSTRGGDSKTICKIQDIIFLKELFDKKVPMKKIAKIFKVNIMTIQRTLHSLNLWYRKKVDKECLLKNKDKTNIEIAKILGVSTATVTRYFKKYNIPRGTGCSNHLNFQNRKRYK